MAERSDRTGRSTTTTAPPDCAQMLPVEARAAQMLLVMVTAPELAKDPIAAGTVGGFGLKGNQTSDVGTDIATTVADAPLPPFVGADEEGGTVQRLRLALGKLASAAETAKGTPQEAATAAGTHATAMKKLGFNLNFAPVADVGSGSGLGTRSYGDDPTKVSTFVNAVFPAISDAGIVPVVKHWPGIGGGGADPHQKLTTLDGIEELRAKDLIPFQQAIKAGAPAIMVTHAEVPGLTAPDEPASLSKAAITGELRGSEGFEGLVITDSLGMGAIAATDTQAQAAEKAIVAGADIAMLSGADAVGSAHQQLVDALSSGRIPPEQALASVRRVLKAKGVEGQCLDAVARYSAIARTTTTSTPAAGTGTGTGTATVTTVAGRGTATTSSAPSGSGTRRTTTTIDSDINDTGINDTGINDG